MMGQWTLLILVVAGLVAVEAHPAGEVLRSIATEPFPMGEEKSRCKHDSDMYIVALGRLEPWAIQMYDAASKIPSGILSGNTVLLGQYDQCLAVEGPEFQGQYCNVHVDAEILANVTVYPGSFKELLMSLDDTLGSHGSHSYRWSICVPSSCDLLDVNRGLLKALKPLNKVSSGVAVRVMDIACSAVKWQAVGVADYVFLVVTSFVFFIIVCATVYDFCVMKSFVNESEKWNRIRCLSLKTSWLMLLESKRFPGRINCLSGLRFLSVAWIILAHTFYTVGNPPNMDSLELESWKFQLSPSQLISAAVATDTFFLLAGFTLTLGFIKYCKIHKGPPKIYLFWLRKILSILPAYALVVFFHASTVRLIGDGPLWDRIVGSEARRCQKYWWANLLFISNFFSVENQCINQSWYFAVDMQLYLVIGPLLYAIWRFFNHARAVGPIIGFPLTASIITALAVTASENLSRVVLKTNDELANLYDKIYIQAYTQAEPFVIGMGLGYFMSYYQGRALPLNRVLVLFLWLCSFLLLIPTVFVGRNMPARHLHVYITESAFFAAFQRTSWSLVVSWVILACSNGLAGPIDYVLSLSFFEPLNKLMNCSLLAHFVFIYYAVGIRLTPNAVSTYLVLQSVFGLLATSILAGFLLFLFVEQPINSLMRSFGQERVNVTEHEMQINVPHDERNSSNEATELSCLDNQQGTSSEENEANVPPQEGEGSGISGLSAASISAPSVSD